MEFIFELILEIVLTPIIDAVMCFIGRIIPEEKMPKGIIWTVKIILGIIILATIFTFFIGLIAWIGAEDTVDKEFGKKLLLFSLVSFGIFAVIRIFSPNKDLNDM